LQSHVCRFKKELKKRKANLDEYSKSGEVCSLDQCVEVVSINFDLKQSISWHCLTVWFWNPAADGLQYLDLAIGSGEEVSKGMKVTVSFSSDAS
jgi:hypothetical protein